MTRHISIRRFPVRRLRWLAVLAVVCLALAPVLMVAGMASAFAAQGRGADGSIVVHVHADGTAHRHSGASHHAAKLPKADGGKSRVSCADGCCLGKGCPLCSLAGDGDTSTSVEVATTGFGGSSLPTAAGIVPPPPSEPPRV